MLLILLLLLLLLYFPFFSAATKPCDCCYVVCSGTAYHPPSLQHTHPVCVCVCVRVCISVDVCRFSEFRYNTKCSTDGVSFDDCNPTHILKLNCFSAMPVSQHRLISELLFPF